MLTACHLRNTLFAILIAGSVAVRASALTAERDSLEIDALHYAHQKRRAEVTPYLTANSTQRLGVGAAVVLKSSPHVLLEGGLAYVPQQPELSVRTATELNYLAAPVSLKLFAQDSNLGFFLKTAIVPSYLLTAQNERDLFKGSDLQLWLGAGGLFPSQMQNRIFFDLVWGHSLFSVAKDRVIYNTDLIFAVGLTL